MYQFFVEPSQIQDKKVTITGSDVNHMRNVLRLKTGEEIAVRCSGDDKEYRCGIRLSVPCALSRKREWNCPLKFISSRGFPRRIRWNSLSRKRWSSVYSR